MFSFPKPAHVYSVLFFSKEKWAEYLYFILSRYEKEICYTLHSQIQVRYVLVSTLFRLRFGSANAWVPYN